MNRFQRSAVIIKLLEKLKSEGSWCGDTHIQKATYLLQNLKNIPLGYDFVLYKHGPFSFDLSDDLTMMRADNVLKYQPTLPAYGPSVVESENAELIKKLFRKSFTNYESEIDFVTKKVGKAGVKELEKLATALFVKLNFSDEINLITKLRELKPHISETDAAEAFGEVDRFMSEV